MFELKKFKQVEDDQTRFIVVCQHGDCSKIYTSIYKFFDHDKIVYLEADYWRAQSHDKIGLGAQEGGEHDCKVVY